MPGGIESLNTLLGNVGILLMLLTAVLLADLLGNKGIIFRGMAHRFGLISLTLVSIAVSLVTLVYSEYFLVLPCGLCWLQRIFLFSQAAMLPLAIWRNEFAIARYGILLSSLGALTALYHHYLQMGGGAFIRCPAAGEGADCAKRILFEYGFVTFPLLSATVFLFMIVVYLYLLKPPLKQKI